MDPTIRTCKPLALLAILFSLAACATTPVKPEEPSVYASYLAGYVAAQSGAHGEAGRQMSRALRASEAQDRAIQEQVTGAAIRAALDANDITRAFALAKRGETYRSAEADLRLVGLAARCCSLDVAADTPFPDESAEFREGGAQREGLALAIPYVAAWSLLGRQDTQGALAALPEADETLFDLQMVPVSRALILDIADSDEAALAYAEAIAGQARVVMLADAFARLLLRRGDAEGAAELYDVLASDDTGTRVSESGQRLIAAGIEPGRLIPTPEAGLADLFATLGLYLAAEGRENDALLLMRLAVGVAPDLREARFALAEYLRSRGELEDAEAVIMNFKGRLHPRMIAFQALLAEEKGEPRKALEYWDKLIDGDAYSAYALDRADLLLRVGRFGDAVETLDPIIEAMPLDAQGSWWPYLARGRAHLALADWASAEPDLLRALVLAPENASVLAALGEGIARHGEKPLSGLALLEKAARKEGYNGEFLKAMGRAQLHVGRTEDAIVTLERALRLLPASPETLEHLGDAYWRAGRLREAGYQWRHALELSADAASKARLLAKLEDPIGVMSKPEKAAL